ncbi:MAG: hypothetical protein AAF658_21630, partial [Myxococcota bacterium]
MPGPKRAAKSHQGFRVRDTRPKSMVDAVIFDLGGVLIDWNPRYLYRKLMSDPDHVEWFLEHVCPPSWNALHDAGQRFEVGIEERCRAFPELAPYIRCYFDRWPEMLGEAIAESVHLFETLRRSTTPVYGLTNWSAETFP